MQSRITNDRQWQRGFTLMEILVAMAIFTTVFIVALLLYCCLLLQRRIHQKLHGLPLPLGVCFVVFF